MLYILCTNTLYICQLTHNNYSQSYGYNWSGKTHTGLSYTYIYSPLQQFVRAKKYIGIYGNTELTFLRDIYISIAEEFSFAKN